MSQLLGIQIGNCHHLIVTASTRCDKSVRTVLSHIWAGLIIIALLGTLITCPISKLEEKFCYSSEKSKRLIRGCLDEKTLLIIRYNLTCQRAHLIRK